MRVSRGIERRDTIAQVKDLKVEIAQRKDIGVNLTF